MNAYEKWYFACLLSVEVVAVLVTLVALTLGKI